VVCDNLKAAVTNPDRYDPRINRTYAEMAGYYGTAILAARLRRPKDKAKVEVAAQIAQRWVLARLRNQRFFVNRRWIGTPYRHPKGTPLNGEFGR
jgi:transposase